MLSLLNAIYSRFNASLAGSIPGGLHRDRAAAGVAMPYVVSSVVSASTTHAYGGRKRTETAVRFSIVGIQHDSSGALAEAFIAAFDDSLLSLGDGANDLVVRQGEAAPRYLGTDGQGNDVWEWTVQYLFGVVSGS